MPPATPTPLAARSSPPRAIAEIETNTSVTGPPLGVALTPDERLALLSCPVKADPNDKTKLVSHDELQVVDLEASPPRVIARLAKPRLPCGPSVNPPRSLPDGARADDAGASL